MKNENGGTSFVSTHRRYAGEVKRYHVWPTLREQTTGQHTWQVMRIYCELFGLMSPEVSYRVLHHDSGELNAGDVAHHVKAKMPELKALMDRAETLGLQSIGIVLPEVSLREALRIKACDLLEMAEFAVEEILSGNRLAVGIVTNIEWALYNHLGRMQEADCADDVVAVAHFVAVMNGRSERAGGPDFPITQLDGIDRR